MGRTSLARSLVASAVLFDSLEKRTRLEAIAAAVQQIVRRRPIGTAMTYAMHVASDERIAWPISFRRPE